MYGLITLAYSIVVLTRKFITCVYGPQAVYIEDIGWVSSLVACSLFLVYLGFLFILVVFCDQITIILNRMSIYDRVRIDNGRITPE